jgi:serine/threonine protein kinase/Tfp pilus assembly protein PilF
MNSISEPIAQDQRVTRAVEEYLAAWETGRRPNRQEFLAQHTDIADALAECLDGLDFIRSAAPDLRQETGPYTQSDNIQPEGPLGDFRIVREIGRGGMGVVYEAEQISLGRRVALKVLPFASTLDSKQLQRFKNEAQAAAHLHHTNIVPVFATGCERGVHYYAMQFIEGQTLASIIADLRAQAQRAEKPTDERSMAAAEAPAVPVEEQAAQEPPAVDSWATVAGVVGEPPVSLASSPTHAIAGISTEPSTRDARFYQCVATLGIQAAEALEHAHALGVIHRDIKPANLMVQSEAAETGPKFRVWVTDFGLAHCQNQVGLTVTGDLMGTLRYMSPEQALAKRVLIDHRTDIYSLGVTLYELLTLEPVFPGRDRQELLRQIAFEEPRPPRRWNKNIPAELETVVRKAMEKEPANRYLTAQDLADDLERFLEDKPIRAKRPTWIQQVRKWQRRHRTIVVISGLAALLILIVTAGLLAVNTVQIRAEQRRTKVERDRAQAALAAEEEQRQLAEENLRLALQALDEVFIAPAEAEVFSAERQRRSLAPERFQRVDRIQLQKGLEFYEKFAQANYSSPALQGEIGKAHQFAGWILMRLGQNVKAEVAFRRAIAILEKVQAGPPAGIDSRQALVCAYRLGESYRWLGHMLIRAGRLEEAEGLLRRGVAVSAELVAAAPGAPGNRLQLCETWRLLGDVLGKAGRPQEARRCYKQALEVARGIMADFPALGEVASYDECHWLGNLLQDLGRHQEAERPYRLNLDLAHRLVAESPAVVEHWQKLALSQSSLARLYVRTGRLDEAEQVYRQGIKLSEQAASRFPDVATYPDGPAWSHVSLGDVLWVRGQYAAAAEEYQRAVTIKPDYADGHWKLAWFLANCAEVRFRDPGRAVEAAKKALALTSQNGHYWKSLGWASYRAGKWEVAIQALETANRHCVGGGSYEWFPLAMAHWRRGDREQARQWYVRACRWMDDHEDKCNREPGYFWDEELRRFRAEAEEVLEIRAEEN